MNPFLQPEPSDDGTDRQLFIGVCIGGPLAGEQWESRYPKGFLLVDKEMNKCWIYDWTGDGFKVRNDEAAPVLTEGPKNRYRAAEEFDYDVIAAPWGGDSNDNAGA